MSKIDIFPTPLLFRLKFGDVSFGVDPSCWGLQRIQYNIRLLHRSQTATATASEIVRPIIREIIFAEFQPRPIRYLNVYIDRQTDKTCLGNTALR